MRLRGGVPIGQPTLSLGDVAVVAAPVDAAGLARIVVRIGRIPGVDSVVVQRLDRGRAHLNVQVLQPTALAGELRRVLGAELVDCLIVDGEIELSLEDPAHRQAYVGTRRAASDSTPPRAAGSATDEQDRQGAFGGHAAQVAMAGAVSGMRDLSILTFDLEQQFTAVAGTVHERFGHRPEQMMGRPARAIVRPETWPLLESGFRGALAGRSSTIQVPGILPGARFEAAFSPVLAGSVVVGGMVITRDVTKAHQSEMLAVELHTVLDITFDHSPVAQALLSPEGRWLRVNDGLCRLLGRTEPELVTRSIFDVTHIEDVHDASERLNNLLSGAQDEYDCRKRFVDPSGRSVPVLVRMTLVRAPDGASQGLVAQVLLDATNAGPPTT